MHRVELDKLTSPHSGTVRCCQSLIKRLDGVVNKEWVQILLGCEALEMTLTSQSLCFLFFKWEE